MECVVVFLLMVASSAMGFYLALKIAKRIWKE